MNLAAIIQARVGSTRYPNKIFSDLCGQPLIWHIVHRLSFSHKINNIIIATTKNPKDDIIKIWAETNNIKCFRGSEEDVLSRYFGAAESYNSDVIVRITSDDPFKDPEIIDHVIDMFFEHKLDFAYNNNPPSFPEGLDAEVFSFHSLATAQLESNDTYEREHVTQYFYRNADKFRQMNYKYKEDLSFLRWTIDTKKDYEMAKTVYEALYRENGIFLMPDILELIKKNPSIPSINSDVRKSDLYVKNNLR